MLKAGEARCVSPRRPFYFESIVIISFPMGARTYPSFRVFRDNRKKWRWCYDLREREPIAASSGAYNSREECERMVAHLQSSHTAPIWVARLDLADA